MTIFQVKTESPAIRCEICHQVDLFDPATGACTRCEGINPDLASQSTVEITTRRPLYQYVGPRNRLFGAYCWNAYLGGLVGMLFFALPLFLVFKEMHFFRSLDGPPLDLKWPLGLFFLFFFVPGAVAGLRTSRFLIRSDSSFTNSELRTIGSHGSVGATLSLSILLFITFFASTPWPLETLFGFLILLLPLGIVCLILNDMAGRLVATVIRFIEKDRIVPETAPLNRGKDSQGG